jgi:hypothetical protein
MATQAEAGESLDMAEEPQNIFLIMLAFEGNGLSDQLTMGLNETPSLCCLRDCKAKRTLNPVVKTVGRPIEKVRISYGLRYGPHAILMGR